MKNYTVDYWADLFAARAADLPIGALNAWIREESQGFPQALGSRYEVGIFQIDLQDGSNWGASTDTLHTAFCASSTSQVRTRDLTDDEEYLQVDSGASYIRSLYALSKQRTEGLGWSEQDLWSLVKLHHALPWIPAQLLPLARSASEAGSWEAFRVYTLGLSHADVAAISPTVAAKYMPFDRFFVNAARVGAGAAGGIMGELGAADLDVMSVLAIVGLVVLAYLFGG